MDWFYTVPEEQSQEPKYRVEHNKNISQQSKYISIWEKENRKRVWIREKESHLK